MTLFMEREPQVEQPKEYWKRIRELEMSMFPEFQEEDIHASKNINYFYFAPSWHFRSGLVSERDVQDFLSHDSKKILSIGSGAAFLEKLLVKLGINKENITLSDINPKDLPSEFKSKTIDMYSDWGDLDQEQYDLIIFPESVLLNVRFKIDKQRQDGLYHLILQSLKHLCENGTIRINGHSQVSENIHAVIERLKNDGYTVEITFTDNLIEVKRGYSAM